MKNRSKNKRDNRLANVSSPYLLQHSEDPVNWFEWGDALKEAKRENKPILLSIGYAACHWCHVMHKESFLDEETAAVMNDLFINVKVDREERPDLDFYFQTQVAFLTNGHGGWPLTVFCTPEGKAFSGGTYFPKNPSYGLPSFIQVLKFVHRKYSLGGIQIKELTNNLEKLSTERYIVENVADENLSTYMVDDFLERLISNYDETYGGFGNTGPKFPQITELRFLLSQYHRKGKKPEILDIVVNSFDKMYSGGIYDHIGFGFHRYSVDRKWAIPHFEKMLYDNAQILFLATELFQITGLAKYKEIVQEIIEYLKREMLSSEGGFYSSQDADVKGNEGTFFIWKKKEIIEVLGSEKGEEFAKYFHITEEGNFAKGYSVVSLSRELETNPEIKDKFEESRNKLFVYREKRDKPLTNENIILSWNALLIRALTYASFVFQEEKYLNLANRALEYILSNMTHTDSSILYRNDRKGNKNALAFSEDYSLLIQALLTLFSVTGEKDYLDKAMEFQNILDENFWDNQKDGYFASSKKFTDFVVPDKPVIMFSLPSANSVSLENLTRLHYYTGKQEYEEKAKKLAKFLVGWSKTHGHLNGDGFQSLDLFLNKPLEIVVIKGGSHGVEDSAILPVLQSYISQSILLVVHKSNLTRLRDLFLLKDKIISFNKMQVTKDVVFICRDFVCSLPLTNSIEVSDNLS